MTKINQNPTGSPKSEAEPRAESATTTRTLSLYRRALTGTPPAEGAPATPTSALRGRITPTPRGPSPLAAPPTRDSSDSDIP